MKTKLERINAYRNAGMSLYEAKRIVERRDIETEICEAKTIDDIKTILWTLSGKVFKA